MLDTNILIYLIKNKPPWIAERVNALAADDDICMSFVSYAELLMGAERSSRKPEVLRQLDQCLCMPVLLLLLDGCFVMDLL
jgi:tRNA(fMet)-specific endonuclease VapC